MTLSGNVPNHMIIGARTGFLNAIKTTPMPWQQVAGQLPMGSHAVDLVDLGAAPMPIEGSPVEQNSLVERVLQVTPRDWSTVVKVSYNALADDQTGTLDRRVRSAGERFQQHMNNLVFKALDAGDAATYGLCYDGNEFFDNAHVDKGAAYTTGQDNVSALALSLDNFATVFNASALFRDDQGEFVEHNYDLLVVPPALRQIAAQIAENQEAYDTGNRERNPFSGVVRYLVSPQMNTTAWVLAASGESFKPLYLAMREQPNLQDAWFDPRGADGGSYNFKFYARYNVVYGDWRLAHMGNT